MATILQRLTTGDWELATSEVIQSELRAMTDPVRRREVEDLAPPAAETVAPGDAEGRRAAALATLGFRAFDALHLACAESAGADVLLTTDDRLIRCARRNAGTLRVKVDNPVSWLSDIDHED